MTLIYILAATAIIAALSLVGIGLFFVKEKNFGKLVLVLVALSAGAMLGNAAFHLLPEALEVAGGGSISLFTVMLLFTAAFVASFLFELVFSWHHCHSAAHHGEAEPVYHCHESPQAYSQLVLFSDGVHNFIDGLIIAASFMVSPALGVTTAVAIALHEVPQELGDYAVLVHGGYQKKKALFVNYLAASTVILGGVVGFFLTQAIDLAIPILLPLAAGSFVYIAASDLLPELKHEEKFKQTLFHAFIFLVGLGIMIATAFLE